MTFLFIIGVVIGYLIFIHFGVIVSLIAIVVLFLLVNNLIEGEAVLLFIPFLYGYLAGAIIGLAIIIALHPSMLMKAFSIFVP